jgi:ATP-dependent DNA helicase RecG
VLAVSHGSASRAFVECSGAPGLQESFRYCKEIEFKIEEIGDFFKAELYQIGSTSSPITPHDTPHVTPHVEKLLLCCEKPAGREQLQEKLGIRDRKYFYKTFLKPAVKTGLLEMTIPEKPRSKLQKYQLTEAGRQWLAGRGQS